MSPHARRDRAVAYGALARLFLPPDPSRVEALRGKGIPDLRDALARMGAGPDLLAGVERLAARLADADPGKLERAYEEVFDPSGGPRCPPNETVYTAVTPQHAMMKSFELADIAGFYRAFGVEMTPGTERPDHIAAELEFMHLLAMKEMVAAAEERGEERVQVCRDASGAFFRDHLGRWFIPFCERLGEEGGPVYGEAAKILEGFLALESRSIE